MRFLGIDSSGLVASVAVLEDDTLLGEYTINYKKTHSETLLPMLDEVIRMLSMEPQDIDVICVAAGPGSFTGLRIGSATAKGLGLALNIPLVSVPTVDALAMNLWGTDRLVCPLMDARRNQTYTGLYEFSGEGRLQVVLPQRAVALTEILEEINDRGRDVIFLGDGVPVFKEQIADICQVPYSFAPAQMNRQRSSSVAVLGRILYEEGHGEKAEEHRPEYLRLSQAERERLEAEQKAEKA